MNKLELRLKIININNSVGRLYDSVVIPNINTYKQIKRQQNKAKFFQYMLDRR